MKILVEHGQHLLRNMGDVAMLQVLVRRLQERWPAAIIGVVANDPKLCARYLPGTQPVFAGLPDLFLLRGMAVLPIPLLFLLKRMLRHPLRWWAAYRQERGRSDPSPITLLEAVAAADLVVAAGGGYLTDSYARVAGDLLHVLDLAGRLGKPTACFGQGLGPLTDRRLKRQVARVLAQCLTVGLREQTVGPQLLNDCGVHPARGLVTGDESLELAWRADPAAGQSGIGIVLRESAGLGVPPKAYATVARIVRQEAARRQAALIPLPISFAFGDSDLRSFERWFPDLAHAPMLDALDDPAVCIARVSTCRVVVTGSYHGAVFALAQGRPAVCLATSRYYDQKLSNLSAMFPGACEVVRLRAPDMARSLSHAIARAWDSADGIGDSIRALALGQIERSRAWFAHFAHGVERHSPTLAV
jgi:colanic acid/amylovoran biosynthesis protein